MTGRIRPTHLSTSTYASARGRLRGVWFLRESYASLRGVGFAYAVMIPFCVQLSHNLLPCNWDTGRYSLVDDDKEEVDDPEKEED